MVGSQRVSHTMNPRSGLSANGVSAVTVIADSCARADAWATALMILPREAGEPLARARHRGAVGRGQRDPGLDPPGRHQMLQSDIGAGRDRGQRHRARPG